MQIINGTEIANEIKDGLRAKNIKANVSPCLALILVGDNKESMVYVGLKQKAAAAVGGKCEFINLPGNITRAELLETIRKLNNNPGIDGILVQLPLPESLNEYQDEVLSAIKPSKDVDGFNPRNRGLLLGGKPDFISCAALACMEIINRTYSQLEGRRVTLIGNSFDVIQPLSIILNTKSCIVTVAPDYDSEFIKDSDIVIVEKGSPLVVKGDDFKDGALVIDAGFHWHNNHSCGNVDRDSTEQTNGWLLPVPGGMGPILIAKLMENLCTAAYRS
ncbi:MAG TPA: bifunctional 5,10-methylenetetrahydrofolate dehydrogenase/5,10-methenyltetrahydrofolate cyclohydrolase [Syntrophomonadaceae bacterium]|nr:bifunctional 5,10-methylenetetrahydrofolate dehydrogenase/5,10-methenyltetrahydrofolate cyclohydrolase [Syntrophomonadaceae bacterium]